MIGHLFRLAWNRRRANALVLVELFVCSLVLCSLATVVTWYTANWMQPLGFDWHDLVRVDMSSGDDERSDQEGREFMATSRTLLTEIRSMPEVELAGMVANLPYSNDTWSGMTWVDGEGILMLHSPSTVEIRDIMKFQILSGRWFNEGDVAGKEVPVVLTENLAKAWFPGGNPLGQVVPYFDAHGQPRTPDPDDPIERIVGVMANYRRDGEPANTPYAEFLLGNLERTGFNSPETIVIRLRPGTPAAFEERLTRKLQSIAPDWSFRTESVERMRSRALRDRLGPIVIAGIVAFFLVFTVGMGLIGVLWQSVSRRTPEFGVRRAMGASSRQVLLQIVGEILALTTLAVAAGTLLFIQVPLIRFFRFIPLPAFGIGIVEAGLVLYLFVTFCGLYPGWLASRVEPAEALQHE